MTRKEYENLLGRLGEIRKFIGFTTEGVRMVSSKDKKIKKSEFFNFECEKWNNKALWMTFANFEKNYKKCK